MLARFVYRSSGPHLVHLHRITSEFLTRQVGISRVLLCSTQSLYAPLFSRAAPVLVTPGNSPKNLHQQIPNEVNINILYRDDSLLITRPYTHSSLQRAPMPSPRGYMLHLARSSRKGDSTLPT